MRIGSLFSGIGGLELGLEWAGVGRTVWQVEQDPFCLEPGHEGLAGIRHHRGDAMDWRHAVAVRGADGTVRLIPAEAAQAGPQSPLRPVAHGVPGRVARLRAIGNAVVPQCAEVVGRRLLEIAGGLI